MRIVVARRHRSRAQKRRPTVTILCLDICTTKHELLHDLVASIRSCNVQPGLLFLVKDREVGSIIQCLLYRFIVTGSTSQQEALIFGGHGE